MLLIHSSKKQTFNFTFQLGVGQNGRVGENALKNVELDFKCEEGHAALRENVMSWMGGGKRENATPRIVVRLELS